MNQFILIENLKGEKTIISLNNITCILPYAKWHCTVYFNGGDDDKVNVKPSIEEMNKILGIDK